MKEKIMKKLQLFQKAYDNKDIDYVDEFMKELFYLEDEIAILGTSSGELCIGYEECKNIFVNDWKYWSFESIDFNRIEIKDFNDYLLVYAPSNFSYTFTDNEDKFLNYLNDIKQDIEDEKELKRKYSEINWILHHFFHQRKNDNRKYLYDLRVCFLFVKVNDDVFVKQIQFSVPESLSDPERMYKTSWLNEEVEKELALLKDNKSLVKDYLINDNVTSFFKDYQSLSSIELVNQYFSKDFIFLGVNHEKTSKRNELISLIEQLHTEWKDLKIYDNSLYVNQSNDSALIMTYAIASKQCDEEAVYLNIKEQINDISNKGVSNKEKLFNIRKVITKGFKDVSIGEEYQYPLRVHALFQKEDNKWKFKYLQFSYHFFYILENKNPYMHIVNDI